MARQINRGPEMYDPDTNEPRFYYQREQRVNELPRAIQQRLSQPRRRFRISRNLLIVLLDIVILIILAALFSGRIFYGLNSVQLAGHLLEMETVTKKDGKVAAIMTITATEETSGNDTLLQITFYTDDQNSWRESISDLRPTKKNRTIEINWQSKEPAPPSSRWLFAEITIDGRMSKLSSRVNN